MNFFDWFLLQQMPSRRKRPELRFYDVLRLSEKPDGTKMSFLDRMKMSYQHAEYAAERAVDGVVSLGRRLIPSKNTMRYLKDGVIHNKLDDEEEFTEDNSEMNRIREEAEKRAREAEARKKDEDEGTTTRMNGRSGKELGGAREPDARIYFDPDRPENRVNSNHVGPDRQITHDTGAWPVKGPEKKSAPRALPAPEPQNVKDEEPAQKQIKGPEGRMALESPDAQARREAGAAASEKGAEKARKITAAAEKTPKPKKAKKSSREAAEPEL